MTRHSGWDQISLVGEPGVEHVLHVTIAAALVSCLAVSAFTFGLGWNLVPYLCLVASAASLAALVLARSGRTKAGILLTLAAVATP
jgi:hypothetical protein